MQYKIPLQIENEDTIVAGLSMRQIVIIMFWWWIGYGVFKSLELKIGWTFALVFASPIVAIGVIVALMKISEMTFLPVVLNTIRLSLNAKSRIWSMGTDSYSDLEIGYVTLPKKAEAAENLTLESKMNDEASKKIGRL